LRSGRQATTLRLTQQLENERDNVPWTLEEPVEAEDRRTARSRTRALVRIRRAWCTALGFTLGPLCGAVPLCGQQDMSAVQIETVDVTDGVFMLIGQGGNIGLFVGADGAFLIDDQFAPLTDKILAAVRAVTDGEVRFVINTHWHGDHTGGNENLGEEGAILVSHENVRDRLLGGWERNRGGQVETVPAAPDGALPVVTFDDDVRFHLNGDELHAFHAPRAHTDGDAIIHFTGKNVIHMGDTYFNGGFPFIDLSSGGSIDGVLEVMNRVLGIADADTRIIPGHGPLSNAAELREARDMLRTLRRRIWAAIEDGRSLEEVQGMNPAAEWDSSHGGGFISTEDIVTTIYRSLGGN
jgi:cyclase